LGQKRTLAVQIRHVGFGPKADSCIAANGIAIRSPRQQP
jgi:hypothetical protein